MKMFAEERYVQIIEMVNRSGKVTVAELSEAIGVSMVTIRRDLEKLEERNLLMRTHGGAMSLDSKLYEVGGERSFAEKQETHVAEKERIAEAASRLIQEEQSVMLTPGTTNMFLAKRLIGRKDITLVTNAVNIAGYLLEQGEIEVLLIGGKLRKKSFATVGPLAEETMKSIRVDKLFLGVDGLDLEEGLSTPNLSEAHINRQMMSIAKEVIVVADHSKFGKVMFSHIASLSEVHTLITDTGADEGDCRRMEQMGIRVIRV
jgi:DeoR family fructose operon transcriptional repressor